MRHVGFDVREEGTKEGTVGMAWGRRRVGEIAVHESLRGKFFMVKLEKKKE